MVRERALAGRQQRIISSPPEVEDMPCIATFSSPPTARSCPAGPFEVKAAASQVKLATVHSISSAPWEAILGAAKKNKADAIVMASHGRTGVSALLLGSETQKVLTHSRVPVIVIR